MTEGVAGHFWIDTPAACLFWIGPEKIVDWAVVRGLLDTFELLNLVKGVEGWGQTSMQAENLLVDDSR